MTVDVGRLAEDGSVPLEFSECIVVPPEYGLVDQEVCLRVLGSLTRAGDRCRLAASANARLVMSCAKCLADCEYDLDIEIAEDFVPLEPEDSDLPDEGELWFFSKDSVDLTPALTANLLLNIPMKALCTDDCPGICPVCGQNLKKSVCGCDKSRTDPRFDVLRSMFNE